MQSVFDGLNLIIQTENSQNVEFPDPADESFEKNEQFFRIESLCVNGNWTEYVSFNNRYLDLIAYINPNFGSINVDPKFNIRTDTTCIQLKLYLNECTRTKSNIAVRFKSLKMCKDVDEFLEGRRVNLEVRDVLLHYGVSLPSIFQLLTKDFSKFNFRVNEIDSLMEIKQTLISNYLNLIQNYIENRDLIQKNRGLLDEALDTFLKEYNSDRTIYKTHKEKIKHKILKHLNHNNQKKINAFYSFYNLLSISQEKVELFKDKVQADMSIYPNLYATIELHNSGTVIIDAYAVNIRAYVFKLAANIVLGTLVRGAVIASGQAAATGLGYAVASFSGVFGLILGAASLLSNPIIANMRSGYYKGSIRMAGYQFRLDCLIRLD